MKSIKFTTLFFTLIALSSCESLIEEKNYNKTPDQFYRTEADALASITAVYAQFLGYNSFGDYYWRVLESAGGAVTSPRPLADFGTILKKTNTSTNAATTDMWDAIYYSIRLANNVIENVPPMNINIEVRNSVHGEALYLRSMHYFNLVRMWGAVPLRLKSIPEFGDPGIRQPESVIYKQIIDDLKVASELLPVTQSLKGRATKGSAYGLLAKVYLTAASMKKHSGNRNGNFDFVNAEEYYKLAKENCQKVTDLGVHRLVDDYLKQFSIHFSLDGTVSSAGYENSVESLFEIQFQNSTRYSGMLPMQLLPTPASKIVKDANGIYTSIPGTTGRGGGYSYNDAGWGEFRMTQTIFNDFYKAHYDTLSKQVDYRIDVAFLGGSKGIVRSFKKGVEQVGDTLFTYPYSPLPAPDLTQRWPYLGKFQDYNATASNQHGANFVYLRYADILLVQAEAENELNDQVNATKHLNMLMARARKADGNLRLVPRDFSSGLSQDSLRIAIWNERNYELIGEAHLWFDLVRTGRYKAFIEKYNTNEYPLNTTVFLKMDVDDRNLLFPIPFKERSVNDKVTQNPGHN
jgi:starch-binding outer membrane protein, SusD/RagB family